MRRRVVSFSAVFGLSGVTRDSTGAFLGGCTVRLLRSGDGSLVAETTSDQSGNFAFTSSENAGTFYVTAYKPGGTDVAGCSVNTLALTQVV